MEIDLGVMSLILDSANKQAMAVAVLLGGLNLVVLIWLIVQIYFEEKSAKKAGSKNEPKPRK